jgi:alpha/beta superfamily hydrolase
VSVIRQGDVLPAERQDVELRTSDGLVLVGELALPLERPPIATVVCLHPLPTHGGSMDSHLIRKASFRLPHQAGMAVLRFNTRGTTSTRGTSDGAFGAAEDEAHDVEAALDYVAGQGLPDVWLLGWSFGSDLTLRYGCVPAVRGAVLLSPTLRWSRPEHLRPWAQSGTPLAVFVPEHDEYLSPEQAFERFRTVPQAEVVVVEGAKHLLFGRAERIFDELVARAVP